MLLQSSELVLEDPALLQLIEEQTQLLGTGQLQHLQAVTAQRLAAP